MGLGKFTLIVLFGIFLITNVSAATEINDCNELQAIGNHDASVQWDYFLGNDIDCSVIANFAPLTISGTLDGKGHIIDNLNINRPTESAGLFGDLGAIDDGYWLYIKNLKLTNVNIIGGGDCRWNGVGGFLGDNSGGRIDITNSYVEGNINGDCNVGGLVGIIRMGAEPGWAHIYDSHFEGNINSGDNAGGLIGYTVGWTNDFQTDKILRSYFNGNINSGGGVGGLIGKATGATKIYVADSHARGSLTSNNGGAVGGLISSYASVHGGFGSTHNYFAVTISTSGTSGGIMGDNPYPGGAGISYSYWDSDLYSGYNCGTEIPGYPCGDNVYGFASVFMKGTPRDTSFPWPWIYRNWDTDVWSFANPSINNGYPYIKPLCGDGSCEPADGEDCSTCSTDCGACPTCGDGNCDPGEGCLSCATDCGCDAPSEYYFCIDSDTNALRRRTESCNAATDNCDGTVTILSTTECTGTTPICKYGVEDCVQCTKSIHCGTDGFTENTNCTGNIYEKEETQFSCSDNTCSSSDSWVQEDCTAIEKICNPTLGCIDPIYVFWQDLSGTVITNANIGNTVFMVYKNGEASADTTFSIYEDDDFWTNGWGAADDKITDITGIVQTPDLIGIWTITQADLDKTDDYKHFKFSINNMKSKDLEISLTPSNHPPTITDIFPPCGYNTTTETKEEISFNVSDSYDFVKGSVTINGIIAYSFPESVGGIHTFPYTFNQPGTSVIIFYAENSGGQNVSIQSNIIVIDTSIDGDYIASCIKSPENFQHITTGLINFDASTTAAIRHDASTETSSNIPFSELLFKWTFSDGSTHPNHDGADPFSWNFTKIIRDFGKNSVTLEVNLQ